MIEDRVRELVAEIQAASDAWTPAERIDAIGDLEAGIGMLQALFNVESATYVDQRKAADKPLESGPGRLAGVPPWRSRWLAGCRGQRWTTSWPSPGS